jgi:hypothetical protein
MREKVCFWLLVCSSQSLSPTAQQSPVQLWFVLETIPILRQQRDWVGGVRKMAIFAADQY